MVIGNLTQIRKLKIINHKTKSFGYHLPDSGIDHAKRFTRARNANYHCPAKWIDIYPPLMLFTSIPKYIGNIDTGIRLYKLLVLIKRLFFHIPPIFSHFLLHQFGNTICSHLKNHCSQKRKKSINNLIKIHSRKDFK